MRRLSRGLGRGAGTRVGQSLIDCCEELGLRAQDLNVRRAFAVGGDDEDGRSLVDAGSNAELAVGLDRGRQFALGIDREWKRDRVGGGETLRELLELAAGLNGVLIGENVVAVIVAQALAFLVEPAGIDCGAGAPRMAGNEEVVANPGNSVFGRGLHEHGIGGCAGWALQVIKLYDGYARCGGRMECGTIEDLRWLALRAGSGRKEQKRGEGEQKAEVEAAIPPEISRRRMMRMG